MPGKRTLFNPGMFLKRIGNQRTSRECRNKQPIFSQGDAADAMFYVEAGNVKMTVLSKTRQEGGHHHFSARRLAGIAVVVLIISLVSGRRTA